MVSRSLRVSLTDRPFPETRDLQGDPRSPKSQLSRGRTLGLDLHQISVLRGQRSSVMCLTFDPSWYRPRSSSATCFF